MTNANDGRGLPAAHCGLRPGDYPLGSLESRAAARAMLAAQEPRFSEEDADALVLYEGAVLRVTARMSPDYQDLQGLEIYKFGKKVHEAIHGKIVPMYLEPVAHLGLYAEHTGLQFEVSRQ